MIFNFCDDEEMTDESQDCDPRLSHRAGALKTTGQEVSDAGRVDGGRMDLPEKRGVLFTICVFRKKSCYIARSGTRVFEASADGG